jgi:enolase
MSLKIVAVHAVEVLDSRARPTLAVTVTVGSGLVVAAGVPSGASTGSGEAMELRDHDLARYGGQGVRIAIGNVNGPIADALCGRTFPDQVAVDAALRDLDGTPDKSRLGANALVGVSIAASRGFAAAAGVPLWQHLTPPGIAPRLPAPHFNVINGGVHAPNTLDFQEFMLAPLGAPTFSDAVRAGAEIYAALKARLASQGYATGLGDEGGFAPDIAHPADVLTLLVAAITESGYTSGRDGVAIALDPASSEFYRDGSYHVAGQTHSTGDMIEMYSELADRFPIWSIEDGLAEDDWDGWVSLTERLGDRLQIVGDDIFVTNPAIIADAAARGVGNAALIKVNQIGTVTETLEAFATCRHAGYDAMVSHRSGETSDSFIADLTVGSGCGQLKSGAPARGERTAKYNRLLEISDAVPGMPYGAP